MNTNSVPTKQSIRDRGRLYPTAVGVVAALFLFGVAAAHSARTVSAASLATYSVLVGDGQSGAVYVLSPGAASPTSIPAPVPAGVEDLVVSPDGSEVYVDFSNGAIGVIDTASDTYAGSLIQLGSGIHPGPMVITPNGQDLYVVESGEDHVVEVNLLSGTVMAPAIETGPVLNLAISPDGKSLYFDGGSQSTGVSVIDTTTNTVASASIPVSAPGALITSPDGPHLYVLTTTSSGPALAAIDLNANVPASSLITLPASAQISELAIAATTGEIYLPDAAAEQLQTIDTATETVGAAGGTLVPGFVPGDIAITPDGATAYLEGITSAGEGELLPVDLGGQVSNSPILLGSGVQPAGLVLVPAGSVAVPTPSPTATPTCSPIMGVGPVVVGPAVFPPAGSPGSVAGSAGSEAAPTPTNQPSPRPTSTVSPPVTSAPSVGASVPPTTGPFVCFGTAVIDPLGPRAAAALTSSPATSPTGGVLLPGALALLAIVGAGVILFVRRSGWTMPALRTWRGR